MDVDDTIILTLAVWVFFCTLLVKTVEVYISLLLVGLLGVVAVSDIFINPETKEGLKPAISFLLFLFFVIVMRKVMNVLR